MKVGLIGLGAMGTGMARRLAQAGLLSTLWNRTESKAVALAAELGVVACPNPAALARESDLIVICVSADADVLEVLEAMREGLEQGKIIVDTSTIGVDTVLQAAERAADSGAWYIDAPVSGGKEGAHAGTLVMMVGGDGAAIDRAMPALAAMGRKVVRMGDSGQGQAAKAVNQVMCAGINQAVCEALAFGQALGLDMDTTIGVLSAGAAGNWFLDHRGATMLLGSFEPGFKCALHYKDLAICRRMLDELGVASPVVEMTLKHYQRLLDQGHGEEDISALYRLKQAMFALGNKRSL
ncbi:MAG: NAD(P)-dependent oxidoreductase [Nitrococcus sp.]|nr:NAD(P)-dependent oxidoreductase [Nitrococcus sp.]